MASLPQEVKQVAQLDSLLSYFLVCNLSRTFFHGIFYCVYVYMQVNMLQISLFKHIYCILFPLLLINTGSPVFAYIFMWFVGLGLFLSKSGSGSFVPHILSRISVNSSVDLCVCENNPAQARMRAVVNRHNTFLFLQNQLYVSIDPFIIWAAKMLL